MIVIGVKGGLVGHVTSPVDGLLAAVIEAALVAACLVTLRVTALQAEGLMVVVVVVVIPGASVMAQMLLGMTVPPPLPSLSRSLTLDYLVCFSSCCLKMFVWPMS